MCRRQTIARRGSCWSCYRKHREALLEIPGTSPDVAATGQIVRSVQERLPELPVEDAWAVGAILAWALKRRTKEPVKFQRVMLVVMEFVDCVSLQDAAAATKTDRKNLAMWLHAAGIDTSRGLRLADVERVVAQHRRKETGT